MSIRAIKIIFELDGAGVYYDPHEPPALDGLLAWALAPMHCDRQIPPARDQEPIEIPLPLGRWDINGAWGWCASVLFPDSESAESIQYIRKRFRLGRADLADGSPNLQGGPYREHNLPIPLLLTPRLVGWALGDRGRVEQLLRRNIHYVGKCRAAGKGKIVSVRTEWCDKDWSLVRDGRAQRWLPDANGHRTARPRPPYWNRVGAIPLCEVGDEYRIGGA